MEVVVAYTDSLLTPKSQVSTVRSELRPPSGICLSGLSASQLFFPSSHPSSKCLPSPVHLELVFLQDCATDQYPFAIEGNFPAIDGLVPGARFENARVPIRGCLIVFASVVLWLPRYLIGS